jgi:hypothetical protein
MSKLKARAPEAPKTGKIKGVICGGPKAGKTWFALSFPKPFYFDTEGGARLGRYQERLAKSGGGYMGPKDGTLEFETLIEQIDALSSERHEYKTLVIDSITKIYQTRIAKDEEALGSKAVFGAQKKPAVAMMRRLVARLDRLDMNVWFVAQQVPEWGLLDGKREQVGKAADVWEKLVYELDLTLEVQYHNPKLRTATTTGTRLAGFPMGDRFDLWNGVEDVGYKNFADRYGKDFIEAPVTPITLATPEQVAEIKRLLEVIKVPDAELEKVFSKAGVDDWAELTQEQAAKSVAWLTGKVVAV